MLGLCSLSPISSRVDGFGVEQGADVARLTMSAAARALEDGHTETYAEKRPPRAD